MTCAVFMAYGFWLKKVSFPMGWVCIVFGLVYALSALVLNFGPGQIFVLQKNFVFAVKLLYFALGAWAFVLGVLFLKDWFLIHRGFPEKDPAQEEIKYFSSHSIAIYVTTIILAIVLSALSTLWPVDKYILILGNAALLKGQWQTGMPILVTYVLISMWPLWFVWAFLSVKSFQPSLLKIAYASIFLTASSCMILIFK
jgi:hypothetical protein